MLFQSQMECVHDGGVLLSSFRFAPATRLIVLSALRDWMVRYILAVHIASIDKGYVPSGRRAA